MRRLAIAVSALAWLIQATMALAATPPESKIVDLTFLRRLQAGDVAFSPAPLSGPPAGAARPDLETYDAARFHAEAEAIITDLLAHHTGPKPAHIEFLISESPDYNCTTLLTGEIACTYQVLDQLLRSPQGRNQLAFLLAHELGHRLIAGHGARFAESDKIKQQLAKLGMMTALGLDLALSKHVKSGNSITVIATPAATSAFWNSYFGGIYAGETASGLASLAWSQIEEDQADQFGVFLMDKAGYKVSAAPQLFHALDDMVSNHDLVHDSVTKTVFMHMANAAAVQALLNGKSWINVAGATILAGAGSMDEIGVNHYHRSFADRVKRLTVIVKALKPDDTADVRTALFAGYAREDGAVQAAEAKPAPPPPRAASKRGRTARPVQLAAAKIPPPVTDDWDAAQGSLRDIDELRLSHTVLATLANKGAKAGLELCPLQPRTSRLAISCGVALAGDNQGAAANALFRQALADPLASPRMYRTVALTEAQMKDDPRALATLDDAEKRFPGGQFYPDRIEVLLGGGDLAGAKAAADRCQKDAQNPDTKHVCTNMILQSSLKQT